MIKLNLSRYQVVLPEWPETHSRLFVGRRRVCDRKPSMLSTLVELGHQLFPWGKLMVTRVVSSLGTNLGTPTSTPLVRQQSCTAAKKPLIACGSPRVASV